MTRSALPRSVNFRTLDLNLLRVFDEVMATRNLTRAAQTLAMTQPAVSNALRRLRDALGDELVVRAGYGVAPTPRAVALWPSVREALATLQAAVVADAFDPARSVLSFVIAMADATAALLMPPLIRRLETTAPGVTLRVRPLATRDPRALLQSGEIDLAVGYFPTMIAAIGLQGKRSDTPDGFAHTRLYGGEYVCVLRAGHPLLETLDGGALTLDAYCAARHLLVSFSGRAHGYVDEVLAALDRSRRVVLTVNQFFTAGRVVVGSDLLAVLPRHFLPATGIEDQLVVLELPFALPPVHVDMVWYRRTHALAAHRWLRAEVIAATGALTEVASPASPPP